MRRFTRRSLVTCCALAAAAASLPASAQSSRVGQADAAAMVRLDQAIIAEVALGKLAARNAQSDDLRQLGREIADEHQKALEELRDLARAKGILVPDNPDADDAKALKELEAAPSDEFDGRYVAQMLKDHEKHVRETEAIAGRASDPKFRAIAQQVRGKMMQTLEVAQRAAGRSNASTGASARRPK